MYIMSLIHILQEIKLNLGERQNVDEFEKRKLVLKVVHDEIDKLGDAHIKKYEGSRCISFILNSILKKYSIGDFQEVFVKYVYMLYCNPIDKSLRDC